MLRFFDTVAAVSTPRGKGGIAVIRISGPDTGAILKKVFRSAKDPVKHPRRACFGQIVEGETVLDEGLALFFPAPNSFTGEDVAELSCHGGALLTETVLAAVLAAGAFAAPAGEFTKRALLNGKITLSAAEALGSLLEANTTGQMTLARGGLSGKLSRAVGERFDRLTFLLADAYAKIDFPDEDLNTLSREEFTAALIEEKAKIDTLLDTYRTGHAVAEGLSTVICGPVNAGKSTLYNALVGRDAAIVTDVAGTTRDILCETVALGAVTLRLYDTAGLRETDDTVEGIGVERAKKAMDQAELILAVIDATAPFGRAEEAFLDSLADLPATVILLLNKCEKDLPIHERCFEKCKHVLRISAKGGDLSALRALVETLYLNDGISLGEDAVVANARQYAALKRCADGLAVAISSLQAGIPLDAACVDAELAVQALGEVDGRAVDETIIASIFSHFCVGK
ncbi:MAG: tRNA uridine-5-carboxymethylaminomethyl(34) synthesis GTPase MnmE [Ruminococcaceae bacterium]|nr:tRNA uridine-5-carboxymethylaminomethyl(34) synthesis GTPase MnmE [Oscillospiraceae bacterium]